MNNLTKLTIYFDNAVTISGIFCIKIKTYVNKKKFININANKHII
jgi:hypothetical protein